MDKDGERPAEQTFVPGEIRPEGEDSITAEAVRNAAAEAPIEEIGGDETGATTGVNPGERPIIAGDEELPLGNDPTVPGGGHGEGP